MAFHMGKRPVVSCFSPSCALLCRCLCMCAWPFLASALATIRRPLRVESPCVWLPFEAREANRIGSPSRAGAKMKERGVAPRILRSVLLAWA
eukprot:872895-Rhodomonas_salina.5